MPKNISECLDLLKNNLFLIIVMCVSFGITVSFTFTIFANDLTKRVELLEDSSKRMDQSCATLEDRYNNDVNTYWNPLVRKFNHYTETTDHIIDEHAKMLDEHEERITEVEGRRFF